MTSTLPRKRTRDDDDSDGPSRKLFASSSRDESSPEPREIDSLEVSFTLTSSKCLSLKTGPVAQTFRKEAIYRRMKYYSREHEKAKQRLDEAKLESRKLEAAIVAMETCWKTVRRF
jgi:E3 ubiquitin-protein ligase BRE1